MVEEIDVAKLIWGESGELQTNIDSAIFTKINEIIREINRLLEKEKDMKER